MFVFPPTVFESRIHGPPRESTAQYTCVQPRLFLRPWVFSLAMATQGKHTGVAYIFVVLVYLRFAPKIM